jgi:hypothetical protein
MAAATEDPRRSSYPTTANTIFPEIHREYDVFVPPLRSIKEMANISQSYVQYKGGGDLYVCMSDKPQTRDANVVFFPDNLGRNADVMTGLITVSSKTYDMLTQLQARVGAAIYAHLHETMPHILNSKFRAHTPEAFIQAARMGVVSNMMTGDTQVNFKCNTESPGTAILAIDENKEVYRLNRERRLLNEKQSHVAANAVCYFRPLVYVDFTGVWGISYRFVRGLVRPMLVNAGSNDDCIVSFPGVDAATLALLEPYRTTAPGDGDLSADDEGTLLVNIAHFTATKANTPSPYETKDSNQDDVKPNLDKRQRTE